MKGEKILIFGDSYSTFKGYVPEGYAVYYPREEAVTVQDVSKTWWYMLASETESEIVLNNSWSGSTICNTGYQGDCSQTNSFLHRLDLLIKSDFFSDNEIDRVFVFGGTNDNWTNNTLGELKYSDWTSEELRLVLPGICCFIHGLQSMISEKKIHVIINSNLKPEITNGFISICDHYGISYTKLENIEKVAGHPTFAGMKAIKDQILADL